jgi:pimeloyl-ACP methyl ester carboxylesterase
MATFVLVHGGWHGAWCWERVVPLLCQAGHRVVAPDLPAHGNDSTPLADRPFERYVPIVCEVVEAQVEPVILLGHSSGGMIISDVARQRPEHVAALVYLAAFLLPPGVAPPAMMRDDTESLLPASLVVDHERKVVTVKHECATQVFYADCAPDVAEWATRRLTPEPLVPADVANVVTASADEAMVAAIPRFYIECLQDRALGPATQRRMYTTMPCRKIYGLETGHSPFLSAPEQLAACLLDIATSLGLLASEHVIG